MRTFTQTFLFLSLLLCSWVTSFGQAIKCGTYTSSPSAIINDTNDPVDNIIITGTSPNFIVDLNVVIKIDHTSLEDLDITLTSPGGTSVDIMLDQCAGFSDIDITFDDEGDPFTCGNQITGSFTPPSGFLSAFDGETFDGTWKLSVVDDATGNDGTLVQWCLLPSLAPPAMCSIDGIGIGSQSACDPSTNTYNQDITVSYTTPPSSGMLFANGQQFPITSSPQTITLTGLPANGLPVTANIYFTNAPSCSYYKAGAFTAASDCTPTPIDNCGSYSSTPGANITLGVPVADQILVSGTGSMVLGDLNVILQINHTWLEDLDITLTSPNGTSVDLMLDQCGSNDNMNIEFDDEASSTINCSTPTIGTFIPPNGVLSDFDGQNFDGTWTLSVVDDGNGDDGKLLQWCIIPTLVIPSPCQITNVEAGLQSACNPPTNAYTQDITISYLDPPSSGMLNVNGQLFPITSSPQTVTLLGLIADEQDVEVDVFFTSTFLCNFNAPALFTAPADCTPICGSTQTDSGGTGGIYSADENTTWTLCPDNAGEVLSISFSSFEVEGNGAGSCWDALFIYNGPTSADPLLGPTAGYCYQSLTGGTSYPGGALNTPITSTHPTGCLTFTFISDESFNYAGWEATVSCSAPEMACGSSDVALAPTSLTNLSPMCMQGAWTYYGDGLNTYFALEKYPVGGNDASFTADVSILVDPSIGRAEDFGAPNATYTMNRYWDVNLLSGSLNGAVNVKFFYDPAEKAAIEAAATNFMAATSAPIITNFSWFKTNTGTFDPNTLVTPTGLINATTIPESNTGVENGATFVQHDGITSFSGGTGTISVGGAFLPIDLVAFSGQIRSTGNLIIWETSSTDNIDYYELQSSRNGIEFQAIHETKGIQDSWTNISYNHLDPVVENGLTYYRLKQVNIDGEYSFSDIIVLERVIPHESNLFPNPARDKISLIFNINIAQDLDLDIYDAFGHQVHHQSFFADERTILKQIDVSGFNDGIYFIKINGPNIDLVRKFTKIN